MRFIPIVALITAAAAAVVPRDYVLHEKRDTAPRKWVKRDAVESTHLLPMRIGLKQGNLDKGHELLMEIPRYSQWYTAAEVAAIFEPAQEAVDAIRVWLEQAGIASSRISQSANRQWIQFDAPVAEAESLLATKYWNYEHVHSGRVQIACDEYHIPAIVQEHIDYIQPGLRLMAGGKAQSNAMKKRATNAIEARGFRTSGKANFSGPIFGKTLQGVALPNLNGSTDLSRCDTYVTPPCIKAMYNITTATKAAAGNELGIFEEGDYYAAEDLAEFFALFTKIPPTTEPTLDGIDGGFAPSAYAGGESDLDFQISYPIIYPQGEILFQTDDFFYASGLEGGGGFLNTFFDAIDGSYCTYSAFGETGDSSIDPQYPDPISLGYQGTRQCGKYKPTNVISISYGEQEDDLPTNYQQRQCSEVMKLGMQGISVILASGDSGVAARSTDDGNSDGCLGPNGKVFNPDFPASCPYITAVGATYLPTGGSAARDQEVAVTRFPSGGGFSNIYATPSYQTSAVSTYFTQHNPGYPFYSTAGTNNPSNNITQNGALVYNRGGRGYPDVSAVGDNVLIINNGVPTLIGGTSAAAPVFASILNRINEERIAAGKKTVGFVNPTLYAHSSAFHDITAGNNSGCGTSGFFATPGWDPVTGLGTPNYPALLSVFMALP